MAKVVALAHVKASGTSSSGSSGARRIPWLGGKIVSNKEEALRKFYERKVSAGGAFNDHQIDALQKTLGITVGNEHVGATNRSSHHQQPSNPKKLHATHRPHGKVQASSNKTIVINGRVLGPKVAKSDGNSGHSAARIFVKATSGGGGNKFAKASKAAARGSAGSPPPLALEDKLTLPLDALVSGQKRLWK
ncbi:hypothetical protein PybrP1_003566 [[Pythium] brassicae (nom. inval.)]|nr:hypothetical protein PybrP1_003566 [[Pythium] brassicae (nom. inval.)]